jgi:hypothetical protein
VLRLVVFIQSRPFFIRKRAGWYQAAHEKTAEAMDYQLETSDI